MKWLQPACDCISSWLEFQVRLQHYFTTYKLVSGAKAQITVQRMQGVEHAAHVVEAAVEDYKGLLFGS